MLDISFKNRLQAVQKECLEYVRIIKKNLFVGAQLKLPSCIMELNGKILNLSSDWSIRFPRNAQMQNSDKKKQIKGMEDHLLDLYKYCLNEFVAEMHRQFIQTQNQKDIILQLVAKHYHNYKAFSYWLLKIFYHLDSSTPSTLGSDLHSLSLETLKTGYLIEGRDQFFRTIFDIIQESRQKEVVLDKKVKVLIELFILMGAKTVKLKYKREQGMYDYICQNFEETEKSYKENFEKKFIQQTKEFYKFQISERKNLGVNEFVKQTLKMIKIEKQICLESYSKSFDEIQHLLNQLFVIEQAQQLSYRGVQHLLQVNDIVQLGKLISRNSESQFIVDEFTILIQIYLIKNDSNKVKDKINKNQHSFIAIKYQDQWRRHNKLQKIKCKMMINLNKLTKQFSQQHLMKILRFLTIQLFLLIQRQEKQTVLIKLRGLFLYINFYMKKINFFKVTKNFYKKIAKQNDIEYDLEKHLLQKFNGENNVLVLKHLSTMVQDIQQSQTFDTNQMIHTNLKFDLKPYILTLDSWPIGNIQEEFLSDQYMLDSLREYEKIYQKMHKTRYLQWLFNYGEGQIKYKIQNDTYYFSVTTLQIIAFLLFNQVDQLTIQQMLERTNIKDVELENSLIPFICNKILQRQKQDLDDFSDKSEIIQLNLAFSNSKKTIQLFPNIKMQPKRQKKLEEQTQEERQEIESTIKQRELVVDTQLARIMKSKKTIQHRDLITECQQMITIFRPEGTFIRKRIENLIFTEVIKRDETNLNTYHYLN